MFEKLISQHLYLNKISSLTFMLLLVLMHLYLLPDVINADQLIAKEETDKIKQSWNEVFPIFAGIFGTVDIKIESNAIVCLEDFEEFLRELCRSKNLKLIKTTVTGEQIASLPKPLILIYDDKSNFLVVPEVFEYEQNTAYQVLYSGRQPILVTDLKEKNQLSGEAWYIEHRGEKEVSYEQSGLSLQMSEAIHNFGLVEPGKIQVGLKIKNMGKAPIIVEKPKGSCRCAVAEFADDIILQPLEQTELNISVSIGRGNKGFRYSILIPIENTVRNERHHIIFDVMGNCVDNLPEIVPEKLNFIDVKVGKTNKRVITITESSKTQINNTMLVSSTPALIPSIVDRNSHENKDVCIIEVILEGKLLKMGKTYYETILIETGNAKQSQLKVPVHITTAPQVRVIPSMIAWGMPKIGEKLTRSLSFSSPYGGHLLVSECIAPDGFETLVKKADKEIEIIVSRTFNKLGVNKNHLRIVFAGPPKTEILVPMYAYVQE